jgi:hypothetical protein
MEQLEPNLLTSVPPADISSLPPVPVLRVVRPDRRRRKVLVAVVLALLVPAVVILFLKVPPTDDSFYPRCFLHSYTGLHCPGCGATRVVYALVHGDLPQAFAYNPLFVLMMPYLIYATVRTTYGWFFDRTDLYLSPPTWALRGFLVVLIAYFILRNIPVYPFDLLAPHDLNAAAQP